MSTDTAAAPEPRPAFVPGWTFADKFRKARSIAGLDQREFAERLELTASSVAAYETGRSQPRFRDVTGLAKRIQLLTGIDYAWFLDVDQTVPEAQTLDYGSEGSEHELAPVREISDAPSYRAADARHPAFGLS